MSSKEVPVEEARKTLGDLVIAAMRGETTILTRYGKPAAMIIPYVQESAMADERPQVRRIVSDHESEAVDIEIDLDKATRIDAITWAPEDTGIVCERLTLATTEHGQPIVIVEDVRDAEGDYRNRHTVTNEPYTELQVKGIWLYDGIDLARQDRDEQMADLVSGEFKGVTATVTY